MLKKRYENMRKITNENDRRIAITCKKAIVLEAQSLGFDTIDAYIQYLKARLKDCENKEKKEPIVIPTPDLIKPE